MSDTSDDQPHEEGGHQALWGYIHRRKTDKPPRDDHPQPEGAPENDRRNAKSDGDDQDGKDKKDAPKKMSKEKKRWLIIGAVILVIVLIIIGVLYYLHSRHYEDTDDAFIDGHVSQVSPQASGRVLRLLVDDNQVVAAGQLLVEIDPRDYQVRLVQAQAQREQARAQVILQQANIGQAEANVHVAEAAVFQAERDLARFRAIDPKAITSQQLDNAVANAKSANARLEASIKAVDAAKGQAAVASASVQQAEADMQNAELQLSYTKVIAPIAGRVTRRTVEVGNVIVSGQPLLAVVSNDLWVTANFKETQLTHMRVGQPVDIKVDAYPSITFQAHIDSLQAGSGEAFSSLPAENATGNYVKVVQRVPVKIVFDNQDQRDHYPLAPGLSVEPRVKVR